MPPLFLLGIGKTRKATLIRTYFFVIYRPNVQKCAFINSRRENNLVHYMFLGGQWVFWGASGFFGGPVDFLIHWPPGPGPVVATVQSQDLQCTYM